LLVLGVELRCILPKPLGLFTSPGPMGSSSKPAWHNCGEGCNNKISAAQVQELK